MSFTYKMLEFVGLAAALGRTVDVSRVKSSRAKPASVAPPVAAVSALLSKFAPPGKDAKTLLDLYNTNPWVRSIVGRVSDLVSAQPWYLTDRNGKRIDDHPALAFIRSGSPRLRGGRGISVTQTHIDTAGESFWVIGRDAAKRPASWGVLPPTQVIEVPQTDDPGEVYKVHLISGGVATYAAADVIWFRDPNPLDPYGRGRSITGAMSTELATDEALAEHVNAYLKNNARPDFILTGTENNPLPEKAVERFRAQWLERFQGVDKRGLPAFSASELQLIQLGKTLGENDIALLRPEQRAIITEIYGVPPEVFGRIDNSNRATIDGSQYGLAVYSVDPRLRKLADHLEPVILAEWPELQGFKLHYESPIKDDEKQILDVMKAKPGYFTGNEFRRLAKLEERPELNELPEEPDPLDPTDTGSDPETDPPKKVLANENEKAHKTAATHTKALTVDEIVSVSAALEAPQVRASVSALVEALYTRLVQKYGVGLLSVLESEVNFEVNSAVADWIKRELPDLFDKLDSTTKASLEAALTDGVIADETRDQLAARIDAIFADAIENRSDLIGETEATRLTGFTSQTAAEQAGFGQKMWLSSSDQKVRASHAAMDGQIVDIDQDFQSPDGGTAMHPGDFGDPAEDINCRCAMRPVFPDEKSHTGNVKTYHAKMLAKAHADIRATMRQVFDIQRNAVKVVFEGAAI